DPTGSRFGDPHREVANAHRCGPGLRVRGDELRGDGDGEVAGGELLSAQTHRADCRPRPRRNTVEGGTVYERVERISRVLARTEVGGDEQLGEALNTGRVRWHLQGCRGCEAVEPVTDRGQP